MIIKVNRLGLRESATAARRGWARRLLLRPGLQGTTKLKRSSQTRCREDRALFRSHASSIRPQEYPGYQWNFSEGRRFYIAKHQLCVKPHGTPLPHFPIAIYGFHNAKYSLQ